MAAAPLIEVQGLDALNRAVRDMNKRRPRPLAVRHCEALRDAPSLGFAALTAGNEIDRYEFTADQAVRRLEHRTKAAAPEEVYLLAQALDRAVCHLVAVVRLVENADGDVIVLTPKQRQEFGTECPFLDASELAEAASAAEAALYEVVAAVSAALMEARRQGHLLAAQALEALLGKVGLVNLPDLARDQETPPLRTLAAPGRSTPVAAHAPPAIGPSVAA